MARNKAQAPPIDYDKCYLKTYNSTPLHASAIYFRYSTFGDRSGGRKQIQIKSKEQVMMTSASFTETTPLKSIFLLADSQLLFWRENEQLLLDRVVKEWKRDELKAAYVGASNGDHPDFYAIFVSAMEGAGVSNCRMVSSSLSGADLAFLSDADIILLAGGDAAHLKPSSSLAPAIEQKDRLI